jgi:hypothetical protein
MKEAGCRAILGNLSFHSMTALRQGRCFPWDDKGALILPFAWRVVKSVESRRKAVSSSST